MYIDNDGTVVKSTLVGALAHELVHALTPRNDTNAYNDIGINIDYKGETVTEANKIYKELGLPQQNAYIAQDHIGNTLTLGFQYTKGTPIDRSVVLPVFNKETSVSAQDWDSSTAGNSKDLLIGNANSNTLRAGDGNDFLYGGGGSDILDGGKHNDFLSGDDGIDQLIGGADNDTLRGGSEGDTLYGDLENKNDATVLGNDELYGEDGNDALFRDDGNDVLYGGGGLDSLYGGAGNDYFHDLGRDMVVIADMALLHGGLEQMGRNSYLH